MPERATLTVHAGSSLELPVLDPATPTHVPPAHVPPAHFAEPEHAAAPEHEVVAPAAARRELR